MNPPQTGSQIKSVETHIQNNMTLGLIKWRLVPSLILWFPSQFTLHSYSAKKKIILLSFYIDPTMAVAMQGIWSHHWPMEAIRLSVLPKNTTTERWSAMIIGEHVVLPEPPSLTNHKNLSKNITISDYIFNFFFRGDIVRRGKQIKKQTKTKQITPENPKRRDGVMCSILDVCKLGPVPTEF